MQAMTTTVSWKSYARTYDMLLEYNPFYQQLHREITGYLQQWDIPGGSVLADIGAGTGNYSLAMARLFPRSTVLHFDNNEGMNAVTAAKRPLSLTNHHIYCQSVDDIQLEAESLHGLISVHALYAFPDPEAVLQKMYTWLKPGAPAILVNPVQKMNVLSWKLAIGAHLLRRHGIKKTLQLLRAGKEISQQNTYIRQMQRRGIYRIQSRREFHDAVRSAGLEICWAKATYRRQSELVVARKPD